MKKIIILLLFVVLLTGCDVNYRLEITKDKIVESFDIIGNNDEENLLLQNYIVPIEAFVNSPVYSESNEKIPGVEYYAVTKNGYNQLSANYAFNFEDYKNSNIINRVFSSIKIINEKGSYSIYTGLNVKIFDYYKNLNHLNISVVVDDNFEIISTNSTTQNQNTLTWNINKNNYNNYPMFLEIKDKTYSYNEEEKNTSIISNKTNNKEKINDENDILLLTILLLAFVLILFIIIFGLKKLKNKK